MKFYQLPPEKRRRELEESGVNFNPVDEDTLNRLNELSENVVGSVTLPLSVLKDCLVNGRKWMIPMSTEEASVVAAANHGMGVFLKQGGVIAESRRDGIYGQAVMQINADFDLHNFNKKIPDYITMLNKEFSSLVKHGGGVRKITARQEDELLYILLLVDPAEAMGANKTNAILEFLAQKLLNEEGIVDKLFAILSNYPSQLTSAKVKLSFASLSKTGNEHEGRKIAKKMELLSKISCRDVYRAVTNNKGIMNGVDSVLLATGNDYRAVEAASHALASRDGQYRSLSRWYIKNNFLHGEVILPLAIGVVGGSISSRPDIRQSYSILGKISAKQLAELIASVALANNFAAINAISTKGIQEGHMRLQSRNVVGMLKASEKEKEAVFTKMMENHQYGETAAETFLKELRGK